MTIREAQAACQLKHPQDRAHTPAGATKPAGTRYSLRFILCFPCNMALAFQPHSLQAFNTLGLPAQGLMAQLRTEADIPLLQAFLERSPDTPLFVLGGGSNVVMSASPRHRLLHVATQGRTLLETTTDAHVVEAAAGENWHAFVDWTLQQGWPGLENLALIPGSVGAAPVQNIGAYGIELAERLHSLRALDLHTGQARTFYPEDCGFGYRDSRFKRDGAGRWLILAVRVILPKAWQPRLSYPDLQAWFADQDIGRNPPAPRQVFDAVCAIRQRKLPDPRQLANAGSFFKNPLVTHEQAAALQARYPGLRHYAQADGSVKLAAGWMIEHAGWKGRRLGPVGMHAQQALVLVNHAGATAEDVWALAHAVQADVWQQFGVRLEPEPIAVD